MLLGDTTSGSRLWRRDKLIEVIRYTTRNYLTERKRTNTDPNSLQDDFVDHDANFLVEMGIL